jgi:hypothetical protein
LAARAARVLPCRIVAENAAVIGGFIRAQAAMLNLQHLTNDRRRTKTFPDVDFEFV